MKDWQIVEWIENNLISLEMLQNEQYIIVFYNLDGTENSVVGDSLRDCVKLAKEVQDKQ